MSTFTIVLADTLRESLKNLNPDRRKTDRIPDCFHVKYGFNFNVYRHLPTISFYARLIIYYEDGRWRIDWTVFADDMIIELAESFFSAILDNLMANRDDPWDFFTGPSSASFWQDLTREEFGDYFSHDEWEPRPDDLFSGPQMQWKAFVIAFLSRLTDENARGRCISVYIDTVNSKIRLRI
jgi:hypothetical protein